MSTPEKESSYLCEGIDSLEAYLLSDELYWPLRANQPRLTAGGMLLALQRLRAWLSLTEWENYSSQLDCVRLKWHSAWERKVVREFHSRFDLWRNFLEDIRLCESNVDMYCQQVEYRVMLQLLAAELTIPAPDTDAVKVLDQYHRTIWLPGAFVWESILTSVFPEPDYWYLYGSLK